MIDPLLLDGIIKVLFVLVMITTGAIITRRHIPSLFTTYALQSLLIGCVAFVLYLEDGSNTLLFITLLTFISKVILIPLIMMKVFKTIRAKRDLEFHYISPIGSILISIGLILLVYSALSKVFLPLGLGQISFLGAVLGISLLFMGMFVVFSRRRPITKIIGYLTMENGVLLFSLFFTELPFIIEVLIILDLIMIILLSAILAFGIDSTLKAFYEKLDFFKEWFGED